MVARQLSEVSRFSSFGLLKKNGILLSLKGGDITPEIERTKRMKFISDISECHLSLIGYNDFINDEKKMVRVQINQ